MKKIMHNLYKHGFSLMEMMIVLLIMSIVAAASAPMIARKAARSAAGSNSPLEYLGMGNVFGNQRGVMVLGDVTNRGTNARLFLKDDNNPQIAFGRGNNTATISLDNNNTITLGNGSQTLSIPGDSSVSGAFSAASASLSGAMSANSANITNALTANTANITNELTAKNAKVTNEIVNGNFVLAPKSSSNYISNC